ncbi:MAG TPA: glycosyltransferase family 87 protein [Polyangiaceae bacterium]
MVALAVAACVVRASMSARLGPDLIGNLTGGHFALHDVARMYDRDAQHAYEIGVTQSPLFLDLYISPPHTALFFAPFSALPFRAAFVLFTALSLVAFVLALGKARVLAPDDRILGTFALAFAASEPFAETIVIGQTSGFMLLVWVFGVALALEKRDVAAGVILGLGALKPQLFVLVPVVLVARARWRMLAAFLATGAAMIAIGIVTCGPHAYVAWIDLLRSPAYADVREANMFHMCSIEALLHGLPFAIAVHALVALAATVMLFVFARKTEDEARAWAAAILVTLFATPHLIVYDAVLFIVPALVLARDAAKNRATRLAIVSTFGLAWLVSVAHIPILSVPFVYLAWRATK